MPYPPSTKAKVCHADPPGHLKIKELLNFGMPFKIIIAIAKWNLCTLGTRVKSPIVSFGGVVELDSPMEFILINICWSKAFIESMSFLLICCDSSINLLSCCEVLNNFLSPSIQTSKSLIAVESRIGVH